MQAEKGDVFVAAPESPSAAHQLLHAEPEEIKFMYYNRKDKFVPSACRKAARGMLGSAPAHDRDH
jgi:hypothetical protein